MFKFNFRGLGLSLVALAVLAFGATAAKADTVTFTIDTGSTMPDLNYGTVKLTLLANNSIEVKVDLSVSGAKIVNTGFPASIAFNFAGATNPNLTISGFSLPNYTAVNGGVASDLHMDGFGHFEYGVLFGPQGGGAGTDSVLTFNVAKAGGFTSVFQLVENSVNGDILSPFGIDVIRQGATGVVGTTSTPSGVPEPASMLLLGTGLAGLAGGIRRRRQNKK